MTIFVTSKRLFLWALIASILFNGAALLSRQEDRRPEFKRFEAEKKLMGVRFRLVVYGEDLQMVRPAIIQAFQRIAEIEARMTDYDSNSELMRLCRQATANVPVKVSQDLFRVLSIAQKVSRFSEGAFDPTVGHLSQIWRKARQEKRLPSKSVVESAVDLTGWQKMKLDSQCRTVVFLQKGLRLDLGGIAKGYAADEALRELRLRGFPSSLVDAAGDVTVGDAPPGKDGWKIAISNLQSGKSLTVQNASVATSGDRFQFLKQDGKVYSHIIDPRTGYGTTHRNQVTAFSTEKKNPGAYADAYASAFSVMGPELIQSRLNFSRQNKVRIESQAGFFLPPTGPDSTELSNPDTSQPETRQSEDFFGSPQ